MGLLDDAIREHLDLKRRSGGDPAEIERLEREALGRVRREPTAPVGTAPPLVQVAPEDEVNEPSDQPDDVPRAEIIGMPAERQPKRRGFLHRRAASPEPDSAAGLEHDEPELEQNQPDLGADEPLDHRQSGQIYDDDEPGAAPPALEQHDEDSRARASEPIRPRSPMDDDTVEHEVADGFDDDEYRAFEEEPEVGGDDDVLEETPEFLQDTPDHDRLWFEQRPPKDFDFDD